LGILGISGWKEMRWIGNWVSIVEQIKGCTGLLGQNKRRWW
jgi:hypothetical protein